MVIFKAAVDIKTGVDADNAATYTVTMRLRRLSLYYVVNLVVPCCLLSFIAVATFLLPAGSSDRLGMGTYVLIVMVRLHGNNGNGNVSHTRYRALGPELIPVYRQSARR